MTDETRRRHLKRLRQTCICNTDDLLLKDVAYAMEQAIRRVTERVHGWESLEAMALSSTEVIRSRIRRGEV